MGVRVKLIAVNGGDYVDEDTTGVHAVGNNCGDFGTLCGMHAVDGLQMIVTKKPIDCAQCIGVLEDTKGYTERNNKWY